MNDSRNGTSPQTMVEEPVGRPSHSGRLPVREKAVEPRSKQGRRRVRLTLSLLILIPLASVGVAYYYAQSQSYQSTDDAFIDGHIINVAPKVAGRVDRVLVNDNQVGEEGGSGRRPWTTGISQRTATRRLRPWTTHAPKRAP